MRLKESLGEKVFDLRLLDKHLEDGKVSKAELNEYLAKLSDDTSNLTTIEEVEKKNKAAASAE